jgi:hypothetical protein
MKIKRASLSLIESDKLFELIVPHRLTKAEEREIELFEKEQEKREKRLNGHKKLVKRKKQLH